MSKGRRTSSRRLRRRWEEEEPSGRARAERTPNQTPDPALDLASLVASPESDEARALLAEGEVVACEPIPVGSNYTFATVLANREGARCFAIYKPRRGEIPLWDFPDGTLYRREQAAYLVSAALGWTFVPPTVIREGPYGVGSFQLYVAPAGTMTYQEVLERHLAELRRITLFDHLVNNADRKPGHLIPGADGRLWAIDHGLTFSVDWKLRTIVFDFCGEPVPENLLHDLGALRSDRARLAPLRDQLGELLHPREVKVFLRRVDEMLAERVFPVLDPRYNVPHGLL